MRPMSFCLVGILAIVIAASASGVVRLAPADATAEATSRLIAAGDFVIEAADGNRVFLRSEGLVYECEIRRGLSSCIQISKINGN